MEKLTLYHGSRTALVVAFNRGKLEQCRGTARTSAIVLRRLQSGGKEGA